jgi:NAD(P)-dependent dehydrogenase (short-subunit alcohol dehydrogenase family)
MRIEGCAALVTGGGSGLGQATAEALAAAGCKVAVLDRNAAAAASVAAAIGGVACAADVADPDGVAAALAIARTAHGPARIIVNCAGIATPGRTVGRDGPLPMEAFERVVRVNLFGTFNVLRQAAYAASKGAVVSMTLPIARELARSGVRVVTIAPGLFHTPLMDTLSVEVQQSLAAAIPFPPRLGKPGEFAALVLTVAQNSFLNGETIRLDGALRMAPK